MDNKIALLTDSACDLPAEIIKQHDIKILPLKVIYDHKEFKDRVDIQPEEVYARMPWEIPTTTLPSMQEIHDVLAALRDQGYKKILALFISSGLSGTYAAVQIAARDFPDLQITVMDSRTLSMGLGWLVYEAARDIEAGLTFEQVCAKVEENRAKTEVYYVLETLEYLKRGGRIGKVAAVLGEILKIKPIISVDPEGKYFIYARTRGRQQSIRKLADIIHETAGKHKIKLAVMHGGAEQEAIKIRDKLAELPNVVELVFGQISPTLGVHTGPGLIGVSPLIVFD